MKIAAQLYTLRELLNGKNKAEIFNILKQVKKIGYDVVEIAGFGDITNELALIILEVCTELAIEICASHLGLEFLEENLDWVIEYHKMWGCKHVGIGSMPKEMRSKKGTVEFVKRCNVVCKQLHKNGLTLMYHNHKFEFEKFDEKIMMEILLDTLDPTSIQLELDTYWVQAGGSDPVDWIYKAKGRMHIVHFKDFRIVNDEQQFAEIGQGNLDWDKIIKACEETGILYAVVEQDSFTDDPINSLKISYNYLQNKGLH